MHTDLPNSVRYVKNGEKGKWWRAAYTNKQVHAGWRIVSRKLLLRPDFSEIEHIIRAEFGSKRGATQDFNALQTLLEKPARHVWITFEDGFMWWCTVQNGVKVNPKGQSKEKGNFWLSCKKPWTNLSVKGRLLAISDLPGTVTTTSGFKGTVCTPRDWPAVLRIIHDQKDPDATRSADARDRYQRTILNVVKKLSPQDFEQLIELILARQGWGRIATLEKAREGIDVEVENLAADEVAFVQVKSSASQKVLNDYVERYNLNPAHSDL